MKKIAVTGGLSSGKTSVCQILKSCGAYVVSADEIVHQLLSQNKDLGQQVISLLGSNIITDAQIDRKKIAKIVFSHPEKLKALEQLLHPAVFQEIQKQYEQICNDPSYTLFVAEIPLLFESKGERLFDAVITVAADPAVCKERFTKKSNHSLEEYDQRSARQLSHEHKAKMANYLITNNGNLEELRDSVIKLSKTLVNS